MNELFKKVKKEALITFYRCIITYGLFFAMLLFAMNGLLGKASICGIALIIYMLFDKKER